MNIKHFMKNMRQFYRENGGECTVKIRRIADDGGDYENVGVSGIEFIITPDTGEKSLVLTAK